MEKTTHIIKIIAVGVTEAGINKDNPAMDLLVNLIKQISYCSNKSNVELVSTDNLAYNGDIIKEIVLNKINHNTELYEWILEHINFNLA